MIARILSDPFAIFMVVLFFGASIFVHEYGHYLAARWRKLKIERFSIGFGPRLFGWRDKRGVDWRVSLIPLGGYVALPQLADMRGIEGQPEADEPLPTLSYSDKMIVAGAGAFFNVLFALLLGSILWVTGQPVSEQFETTKVGTISAQLSDADGTLRDSPAARAGLQEGDIIRRIDGRRVDNWQDVVYAVTTGVGRSPNGNPMTELTIERNGEEQTLTAFPVLEEFEGIRQLGISPANTLLIGGIMADSPAAQVGLQPGDRIIKVNGREVYHTSALGSAIRSSGDEPVRLLIDRDGEQLERLIRAEEVVINTAGETLPMIGVRWQQVYEMRHVDPFTQVKEAFTTTIRVLGALLHPRSDVGINNLSGPVGISYTIYIISQIGILDVLSIIVLININLAILNLLPIPVLDGGHMAFATYAKLRGRPVPPAVIASAQGLFMMMFLGLFIYVTFFDVGRVKRNETAISEAENVAAQQVEIRFEGIEQPPQP
jgi:regulator of sigma E protease